MLFTDTIIVADHLFSNKDRYTERQTFEKIILGKQLNLKNLFKAEQKTASLFLEINKEKMKILLNNIKSEDKSERVLVNISKYYYSLFLF